MIGLMLFAAGAAYMLLDSYLKSPGHQRCPSGRRKNLRKLQAKARRILRNPKHRGDRANHRAARRLMKLTRKQKPLYEHSKGCLLEGGPEASQCPSMGCKMLEDIESPTHFVADECTKALHADCDSYICGCECHS